MNSLIKTILIKLASLQNVNKSLWEGVPDLKKAVENE